MKKIYLLGFLVCPLLTFGQITGRVWQDNNANGLPDKSEKGSTSILVRAYTTAGKLLAGTTTGKDGWYTLPIDAGERVRLEFSNLGVGWQAGPRQSQLHFLTAPAEADLGLFDPIHFMGSAPFAVQPLYVNGDYSGKGVDTMAALVAVQVGIGKSSILFRLASPRQVGSVWGLSYDRKGERLFAASLAKRHSGFGPMGSGGIYGLPTSALTTTQKGAAVTDTGQVTPFINLDQLGFPTRPARLTRDLKGSIISLSHDSLMFSLVGKISLGGLAVSPDGKSLYVMNLFDRKLYRILLPPGGSPPSFKDVTTYSLPLLKNASGELRPFAVKYNNEAVYVGAVWDASLSKKAADLKAIVLKLDPNDPKAEFSEVFSSALNYPRGVLDHGVSGWQAWTDDYNKTRVPQAESWLIYPQPILADIAFDTDGSMMLGLMDRLGHQTGDGQLIRPSGSPQLEAFRGLSGGDVLRVARAQNRYVLEQNARVAADETGTLRSVGQNTGEGPGGGEFYSGDSFTADGIAWHHETAMGGLALLPQTGELLVASREPVTGQYLTGGIKWLSNQTGLATRGLSMMPTENKTGYYGKTNNVGDIELIPTPAPIELGDRVWHDRNENGLQDADEPGLASIEVLLYAQGKQVAKTMTSELGQYRFGATSVPGGLRPNTDYEIRIPLRQLSYPGLRLPTPRLSTPPMLTDIPNQLDNDARVDGEAAVIRVSGVQPGESVHGLDVGLRLQEELNIETTTTLSLTPNPATSQSELVYRSPQGEGSVTVSIRDAGGRIVNTLVGNLHAGEYRQRVDLRQLSAGLYFVMVSDGSSPITKSLLKQ